MSYMTESVQQRSIHPILPWIIWGLGAMAFFIEYLVRVAPASMVPSLMHTFNASPSDIGSFAAFFLYAYVLMQIPVGILVDRFGAKICLGLSVVLCAACTMLFAKTDNLLIAKLARLLLGLGSAFALVSTFKLALTWFSPRYFSVLVGFTQSLGMIGGAAGASLMGRLAETQGWQKSTHLFGTVLAILAVLIFIFVRNATAQNSKIALEKSLLTAEPETTVALGKGLAIVFSNAQTWIISIFIGFLFMPTAVFAELWGSFYLMKCQNISLTAANDGIGMVFLGWAIGGPLAGFLSNQFGRRLVMIGSALGTLVFITLILYLPPIPLLPLYALLLVYGILNCGTIAGYTAVAEINSKAVAGIALGFSNGMSVIVGAFCQQGFGIFIDYLQSKRVITDSPESLDFAAGDLKTAMGIVLTGAIIAVIMSFFTKETLKRKG